MKKTLVILSLLIFSATAGAIDYDLWDALLKEYTAPVGGSINYIGVDYQGLKNDPRFTQLREEFAQAKPSELPTDDAKLAFWLNAYNFYTIDLVLTHYPITSIKDEGDLFHPVWQKPIAKIDGQAYSLEEIKILLRQQFHQPLIHTALAGAALSSPDIRQEAYRPEELTIQLREQLRKFLANPAKGFYLDHEENILYLSPVFTWDAEDFKKWGGLINFLEKHILPEDKNYLDNNRYRIKYFPFDWRLNVWPKNKG